MAISKHTPALFTEGLPDPRLQQFRMRRLQVHNWGTFNGLTEVPIAERGFLFVGRSGSGKSTLLDAMSAMLVPPSIVDFNAAAREAERSGRDRNLVSYVRGAWADQQDRGTGEIATQYLRKGATWTALVLEYRAGDGRVVSLVRLFWIAGNGAAAADVRKHYLIAERPFDIAKDLGGFDLDLRKLKQRLADVHHFDSFTGYAERFRHLLGIDNEMALRLLHKTQSAKNLGDLNVFLRDFMLDTPRTFDAAERLVSDFAELDGAHTSVVTARRQVETLLPARALYAELKAMTLQRADEETLKLGLDSFRESRLQRLLEQRLQDIDVHHRGLQGEETQRRQALANREEHLAELELQRRQQGGERIEELEREHGRAQAERDRRQARRDQAGLAAAKLQETLPDQAHGFAQLISRAQAELDNRQQAAAALDDAISERQAGKQDDTRRFGDVRAELEAMERTPSSIPAPLQKLRSRLADETGVPEAALPFVGELIQVRQEEGAWQGAIERVLFGFAQSLLVEDKHYNEVNAWVNRTQLGMRLTYYRVRRNDDAMARSPSARSLLHKLELRDSVFEPWLRRELGKRYDYECVDAKQLRDVERGISREGQVKHPGDRFEKDDRNAIGDKRRWLLGFNNRDKLALYRKEAQELAQRIAECDEDVARLRSQRDHDNERRLACHQLVNYVWEEVDVATAVQRLQDIESSLRQLKEGNADLARLAQQIDHARGDIAQARRTYEDTRVELAQLSRERDKLEAQRQKSRALVLPALGTTQEAGLQKRLEALGGLSLETLEAHMREISKGINESLASSQQDVHRVESQLVACFRRFAQAWPEESGDFTASVASADDFLARLERLERDGLPQHEERFFDLLQNQSKNNLLALQRHSAEARKSIGQRLDEVNASLEQVPFNRGTLLTIELSDRRLPEVLEFHLQLRDVLAQHQTEERQVAEAQFAVLRELVKRLGSQEGEDKRWRENVLDVRLHVEFIGVELDASTRQQVEIYRSGAGKSGGQRQKLATTCLAAALRYQLGGADSQLPSYAAVVLDEAFDKADNEFTALAMNIFENFGFQMVVATPLKSVMTLEPFIGGACFVEISGRHDSGVLLIEYDEEGKRLKLPERARSADPVAPAPGPAEIASAEPDSQVAEATIVAEATPPARSPAAKKAAARSKR